MNSNILNRGKLSIRIENIQPILSVKDMTVGGQGNSGTWVWIGFDGDIFKLHDELKERGVTIRQPPVSHSWAMEMHIEDPDGHVLRFGTDPNYNEPV